MFLIIHGHHFEYYYPWNHSSKFLPLQYQIASFWNGQEGSFLLWIFWNLVLGFVLIRRNTFLPGRVMTLVLLAQSLLLSLILGVVLTDGVKIGSSPFQLLRDVVEDPILKMNPEFVPADGTGLNPLLQNYWMVIHPPVLFLGFASTLIPSLFVLAALWKGFYREWVLPALGWVQFGVVFLGLGTLMGAYWAYETLNFGGYWNWDPVENAIYVPWLFLVAAMHTMVIYRNRGRHLRTSVVLVLLVFLFILYSTFLTRSGILGDTSVHSFTDLGLSGHLVLLVLGFLISAVVLVARRWREIPKGPGEENVISREFWMFAGALTLCLMGFQVLLPTSIPVYNALVESVGLVSRVAPPTSPESFYGGFQKWFALVLVLLTGMVQRMRYGPQSLKSWFSRLLNPLWISLLFSSLLITFYPVQRVDYGIILFCAVFCVVSNAGVVLSVRGGWSRVNLGALAHTGVGVMLVGILFSSGYSTVLSVNRTGLLWSKAFQDEVNRNNLLLFLNEPRRMGDHSLTYMRNLKKTREAGFVEQHLLTPTSHPLKFILSDRSSRIEAIPGDTLSLYNPENTYFEVRYKKEGGRDFYLYPRVQENPKMGIVYSPDIRRTLLGDLYCHVRTFPDPNVERKWKDTLNFKVKRGDYFIVNDYVAHYEGFEVVGADEPQAADITYDYAVKAHISVRDKETSYQANPLFYIDDNRVGTVPDLILDLGIRIGVDSIIPEQDSFNFRVETSQKDWIILEVLHKPLISLMWVGSLLLLFAIAVAMIQKFRGRDRGLVRQE